MTTVRTSHRKDESFSHGRLDITGGFQPISRNDIKSWVRREVVRHYMLTGRFKFRGGKFGSPSYRICAQIFRKTLAKTLGHEQRIIRSSRRESLANLETRGVSDVLIVRQMSEENARPR